MTDKEIFEAVKQRFTDPKVMDLLRAGLADKDEMEDVKRAIRYGDAAMRNPILRDKLYKIFDRLLNVVKDDSTTRQMVKQDLRKLQKGDSAMSEDLNTANVEKAVMHDCAKHVVHEEWGKGQCIPGEHTLLDDGTVTHYDVMFEHGVEQNVAVEDLTVIMSESHMHAKRKKMMEAEEMAPVTPEGGADSSKASKKGKLEMPLERLKAIMEKKKSEAYKAMLRSQGKMEEEVELDEKKLTSAEMKKREEVAKAIERDQPGMPMGKKMAIATATAKRVAEQVQQIDEAAHMVSRLSSETKKHLYNAHKAYAKGVESGEGDEHYKHLDKAEHSHYKAKGSPGEHKGFDSLHHKQQRSLAAALSTHHREPDHETWMKYNVDNVSSGHMQDAHDHGLSEAKAHTVPKTAKEKSLAALAAPHDKITHADVMVGRGVSKKKTMKEFVEKLAESLAPKAE